MANWNSAKLPTGNPPNGQLDLRQINNYSLKYERLAHKIIEIGFQYKKYKRRATDPILKQKLEGKGTVLIEGPKWCGKTTTAEQIASSVLYMDNPERRQQNLAMAELSPKQLLKGAAPRLIDEWQLTPKLWGVIRFEVDHRGEMVPFILMGAGIMPIAETTGYMWFPSAL